MPVAELAERIKGLRAAHAIDAAPERAATHRIAAEMPVTARIRRKPVEVSLCEAIAEPEAAADSVLSAAIPEPHAVSGPAQERVADSAPGTSATAEEPDALPGSDAEAEDAPALPPVLPAGISAPRRPAYRERVARSRRQNERQMSLF